MLKTTGINRLGYERVITGNDQEEETKSHRHTRKKPASLQQSVACVDFSEDTDLQGVCINSLY